MTRILTIIALLFATPAWAASLGVSGLRLSESLNCENGLIVQKAYGDNLTECLVLIVEQHKTVWTPTARLIIQSDEDFAKIKEFTAPYFEKKKKVEQQKKANTRKKTLDGYRTECAEYGYTSGSKELADCVKELDIAAKQNEVLGAKQNEVLGAIKKADEANAQRAKEARKRAAAAWEAQQRAQQGDALMALGLSIMNGGRASPQATPRAGSTGCFLQGSYVSGLNRICNYNCMGSDASHTIGAAELCPFNR